MVLNILMWRCPRATLHKIPVNLDEPACWELLWELIDLIRDPSLSAGEFLEARLCVVNQKTTDGPAPLPTALRIIQEYRGSWSVQTTAFRDCSAAEAQDAGSRSGIAKQTAYRKQQCLKTPAISHGPPGSPFTHLIFDYSA